ncbi:unnamed protein product [Angiostrongylus costaricensis]|uniref:Potassium channel domain-containing protein n=1 Tax=Angiostrongylus costaricensis TaxID=334426 RepID=A0A3P7HV93_ANGCS|nr:unnamed protein product [Angiostrongylus costaricensis]
MYEANLALISPPRRDVKLGGLFFQCLRHHGKALILNTSVIVLLIAYTLIGGFIFLHFEYNYAQFMKMNDTLTKKECIEKLLRRDRNLRSSHETDFAHVIAEKCLTEVQAADPRLEWSFKTAALFGFGILTTLGYGKVEPKTINGRLFTVIYGFIGIPMTVILLTNIGRYLEHVILKVKQVCHLKVGDTDNGNFSGTTLFFVMILYLLLGALFIPLLHGELDFFNGIYFAFICLTAIEYGDLVPDNNWFIPIVIAYVCIGLAISTIALDIGSYYVRKMHYIGRQLKNIANIRIWFGAKSLQVKELVSAVGQNIGISEHAMADIDLETLVNSAILVKLGRLTRVPQTHMIVDGIWPPELVPLFIKDGNFPMFVDSEEELLDATPKKTMVRFQVMNSDVEDITNADISPFNQSRLSSDPTAPSAKSIARTSYVRSRSLESEQSLQNITVDTMI